MKIRPESTLLELVQQVSKSALSDDEVVTLVAYLVNSGRVRLCGTFAGTKIRRQAPFLKSWTKGESQPPPPRDSLHAASGIKGTVVRRALGQNITNDANERCKSLM